MATSTAPDSTRSYLRQVERSAHRYPTFKRLLEFTSLLEQGQPRLSVLEFRSSGVAEQKNRSPKQLGEYLNTPASSTGGKGAKDSSQCQGRLYLLEDLSTAYVEALGGHFNIDPDVFVRHLYLPFWDRDDGDEPHMDQRLPNKLFSAFRTGTSPLAYSLRYYEVRKMSSLAVVGGSRRTTGSNVRRRMLHVRTERAGSYDLILRNVSFWLDGTSSTSTDWKAMRSQVLYRSQNDPGAGEAVHEYISSAYLGGYTSFISWRDRPEVADQTAKAAHELPQTSLFDDIVAFWTHTAGPNDVKMVLQDPKTVATPMHRIVASYWLAFLEFDADAIRQLENMLRAFEQLRQQEQLSRDTATTAVAELRVLLQHVNEWRRRTWWHLDHSRFNLEALSSLSATICLSGCKHNHWAGSSDKITEDFLAIRERVQYCKDRMESLMPVVMGAFSLLEAQQRGQEGEFLTFLSILATVFLPLSFAASLFSMAEDYLPGHRLSGNFWAVSAPLVALIFASVYLIRHRGFGEWKLSRHWRTQPAMREGV
ncbi:hypothetical protein LTR10_021175 [Elasticomyces elasticus]|uniref:Uncharacterized protein n=1 Tax=Exophiala sideris TaxID=1016849 RepID=A0ABR0JNZ6_9EURO|nr:hypothetical protein LTR10_021175 [Elasticomyces elasticus]KAK5038194.1 hypothetical protein LTS07_001663 [Exophiala sideris]KAK5044178.1 hypothetical protein LTR13_000534 [Exophiala sideris]KAK5067678.1 hypothetical protein LTR69_001667 [Exophiala sideris]KAK5184081.1 hypothetical protein LTR44_003587 [Eurotiomycetes sp. CCFEE 6388]